MKKESISFKLPDGRIIKTRKNHEQNFLVVGFDNSRWVVESVEPSLEEAHAMKAEIAYLHLYSKIEILSPL